MSTATAKKDKIIWLSVLQGWAMLLVVIGHANFYVFMNGDGTNDSDWLHRFAYAFHMPLFMFVSGGLFYLTRISRQWNYRDVVVDKLKRLAVPYVALTLFAFVVKASMSTHMKRGIGWNFHDFTEAFLFPDQGPIAEMWFVATLFLLMMLYPLYQWSMRRRWVEVVMLLIWALLIFIDIPWPGFTGELLSLKHVTTYGFYFYAGMICFKYSQHHHLRSITATIVTVALFAVIFALWGEVQLITPLAGILMSVALCKLICRVCPSLFDSFREFTFQIYLIGIFPQMILELFVWNRIPHTVTTLVACYLVSIVSGLYIPVVISRIVNRYGSRHLKMCLGLR